jgi:hypothetical protein
MWDSPTPERKSTMSVKENESVVGFAALESNYAVLINNAIGEQRNSEIPFIVRSYQMETGNKISRKSVIARLRGAF